MCGRCDEKLLVANRQVKCVFIDIMQGEECGNEWQFTCCYCLLTKRSCAIGIQNRVSYTAVMSGTVRIGDYELLKKQNEGYREEAKQLDIESGLTSIKHAIELQMRLC